MPADCSSWAKHSTKVDGTVQIVTLSSASSMSQVSRIDPVLHNTLKADTKAARHQGPLVRAHIAPYDRVRQRSCGPKARYRPYLQLHAEAISARIAADQRLREPRCGGCNGEGSPQWAVRAVPPRAAGVPLRGESAGVAVYRADRRMNESTSSRAARRSACRCLSRMWPRCGD